MSFPTWKDEPSEMVAMLRHAAMDAVLGQGGIVGDTLYAKAADRLHELELALSKGKSRWKSLAKHTPSEGETVLAFWTPEGGKIVPNCYSVATYARPGHWHNPEDDEDDYRDPSHWMPLPSAPETK